MTENVQQMPDHLGEFVATEELSLGILITNQKNEL